MKAIEQLIRVCGLLIDEAELVRVQPQGEEEMVVQVTSIEDLRFAVIAAEQEMRNVHPVKGADQIVHFSGGHNGRCSEFG